MDWLEVTVKTLPKSVELVADMLTALGVDGLIIDDEADFQTFLKDNTKYWDYVDNDLYEKMQGMSQIRFYIEDDVQKDERLAKLRLSLEAMKARAGVDLGSLEISLRRQRDEDWENAWKQYYQPLEIGERILINPVWLPQPEEGDRVVVSLDPGVAFGTGSHASTRMCLQELECRIRGGEEVLDLGCGSGILSIAALKLGASRAYGLDIDDKAADAAAANGKANGYAPPEFETGAGNVLSGSLRLGSFDLVLANIVADVIIPLAPLVKEYMKPGALFLCSGIIGQREGEVTSAIESSGMRILSRREEEDWVQLTASFGG